MLDGGARWRNLENTIEVSMCGGDAAFSSNYFDHLFMKYHYPYVKCRTKLLACHFTNVHVVIMYLCHRYIFGFRKLESWRWRKSLTLTSRLAIWMQYTSVRDRQADRRMDRKTDAGRQTEHRIDIL